MPVEQARDGVEVEADRVYVIPPDHALTIAGGRLRLHALPTPQRAQHPIDLFFESLARDRGHHAIGIVLSGGGSDGTLGIKAIKEHGGLTIAQGTDHSAPRHGSMPSSAIATGLVDLVLPVEEIAEKLVGYVRSFVPTAELVRALPGRDRGGADRGRAPRDLRHPARAGRARVRRLQGEDLPAPGAAADAGRAAGRACRLHRPPAPGPGRGHAAVSRPAHRRHRVLPRSGGVRGPGEHGHPGTVPGQGAGRHGAGLGSGLCHRRGGLLDRDPAARAHGRAAAPAAGAGVRHRHRRGGADPGPGRPLRARRLRGHLARAPAPLLRRGGGRPRAGQGRARDVHLLQPQPDPRSALLAHGPDQLPQPADLPRRGPAGARAPDPALRAPAARLSVPRHLGEHLAAGRPVRGRGPHASHLPAPGGWRRASARAAPDLRPAPGRRLGRRPRAPRGAGAVAAPRRRRPRRRAVRTGPCRGQPRRRRGPLLRAHRQVPRGRVGPSEPAAARHGPQGAAPRPAQRPAGGDGDPPHRDPGADRGRDRRPHPAHRPHRRALGRQRDRSFVPGAVLRSRAAHDARGGRGGVAVARARRRRRRSCARRASGCSR